MNEYELMDWAELILRVRDKCAVPIRYHRLGIYEFHRYLEAFDPTLYEEFRGLTANDQLAVKNLCDDCTSFYPLLDNEVYG